MSATTFEVCTLAQEVKLENERQYQLQPSVQILVGPACMQ